MPLEKTVYDMWYNYGVQAALKGEYVKPTYDALAIEAFEQGRSDAIIRSGNGAPLDQPNPETLAGIGDVTSKERGSGARFNAGKPKLEFIPWGVLRSVTLVPESPSSQALERIAMFLEDFESRKDINGASIAFRYIPDQYRLASTCAVFDYGSRKYAAWNWTKGMAWSVPLACAKRHWLALARGVMLDVESDESHWGHLGCNLVMLIHFATHYPEGDDRPPLEAFAK